MTKGEIIAELSKLSIFDSIVLDTNIKLSTINTSAKRLKINITVSKNNLGCSVVTRTKDN